MQLKTSIVQLSTIAGALFATAAGTLLSACLSSSTPPAASQTEPAASQPEPGTSQTETGSPPSGGVDVLTESDVELKKQEFLPNWSKTGYRFGTEPPSPAVTHSVTDFGAVPNDNQDDTKAFRRALAQTQSAPGVVVLSIPAGEYDLSDILFLTRSRFVLRGAGSGLTTLRVTRPLSQMSLPGRIAQLKSYLSENNKRVDGELFSVFSWTGGVIWSRLPKADQIDFDGLGPFLGAPVSALSGLRGALELQVERPQAFEVGKSYKVRWTNREGSRSTFLEHLYGGVPEPFAARLIEDPEMVLAQQDLTITAIEGDTLRFQEPLLHDVREEWQVMVGKVEHLEEVGIEGLSISFPDLPYRGHHKEAGFNGLHLNDLRNSWVRDVTIHNSDSGILTDRSSQLTLKQIKITGRGGHYGVHCGSVYAMLTRDFKVAPGFAHSVSFNTRCAKSVFHQGEITDGSLDQHRGVNHQNLYDSIVAHETEPRSRLFEHGGAAYFGPVHGAFNTFWGVEVRFAEEALKSADAKVSLGEVKAPGLAYLSRLQSNLKTVLRYENAQPLSEPEADSLYLFQRGELLRSYSGGSPQITPSPQ